MQRLFSVNVHILDTHIAKSDLGQVNMIVFSGSIDAPFFKGETLSGACDTQKYMAGERGRLSARYMLKGVDSEGTETMLFIENNAVLQDNDDWKTEPVILTDNPKLSWLQEERLRGEIEATMDGVNIHFYQTEENVREG